MAAAAAYVYGRRSHGGGTSCSVQGALARAQFTKDPSMRAGACSGLSTIVACSPDIAMGTAAASSIKIQSADDVQRSLSFCLSFLYALDM